MLLLLKPYIDSGRMINLREHFKLSAIYTFFAAFPALLQLVVYPVIEGEARLGPVDFGYLAITEAIITIVFIVCTFGMGSGITRFYYDHKDDPAGYKNLVSGILTGILGRGLLLLGVVLVLAPHIGQLFPQEALQDFGRYGPALVISGLNRSIITTLLALYRNEKKVQAFAAVSFFSGIFRSGFQLAGVFLLELSFIGYVHGTAAGGSVIALILVVYTYSRCGLRYNRSLMGELRRFTGPLFMTELIFWGLLFADRFFLLKDPESLGIYDNAMKFAIGLQMIIQGLSSAVQPEIFRYLKEGADKRKEEIRSLTGIFMAEATGIIAVSIIPVMVFISVFYETGLTMSAGLVTVVFVRFILRAQYQVFAWPLLFKKKSAIFFYLNSSVLAINLGINWLITPKIGYYGAIIAFLTAYIIQIIALQILQRRHAPSAYDNTKVFSFPLSVVVLAIALEILKVAFSLEPFVTSSLLVIYVAAGMTRVYREDIVSILRPKRG